MDGSSMPRPQPSAKGQQGALEISVSEDEMARYYQQVIANSHGQIGYNAMLAQKLRAALADRDEAIAERDAKIAELEAENAALKTTPEVVSFEVTAGEDLPWRKEVNGLKSAD